VGPPAYPPYPPAYPAYPPPLYPGYAYYPMGPPRAPLDGLREVGSVVWSGGVVVFTIAALLSLATFLFLAGTMIAPGIMTAGPTDCVVNSAGERGPCAAVLFLVSPVPPFIHAMAGPLVGNAFLLYFLLLMAFVVAAYLVHLRDGRHLLESAKRPLKDFRGRFGTKSSWATVGQLWMATFFLQVVLALALGGTSEPPAVGQGDPRWYLFYGLGQASVHEELVTRALFIGVPLALFALATARPSGTGPRALGRALLRVLGGGVDRNAPPGVLLLGLVTVLFSSIVFGLAHVPYWGLWKFVPTFFAGIAMGYVFLRHGLGAAILFHFVNDYFVGTTLYFIDDTAALAFLGLLVLIILVLGAIFLVVYLVHAVETLGEVIPRILGRPSPSVVSNGPSMLPATPAYSPQMPRVEPQTAMAPPSPAPRAWFLCPYCAGSEAALVSGRFQCLRCGGWS